MKFKLNDRVKIKGDQYNTMVVKEIQKDGTILCVHWSGSEYEEIELEEDQLKYAHEV